MVSPPGTHFTADSTEAMWIKCLAHGHYMLMHFGFEPSIAVSTNREGCLFSAMCHPEKWHSINVFAETTTENFTSIEGVTIH